MNPSRRDLYELLKHTHFADRSDVVNEFLLEHFRISPSASNDVKHAVRRCASRFVSNYEEKMKECHRKKNIFELKYKAWLDGTPTYPDVTILSEIAFSPQDHIVPVPNANLTPAPSQAPIMLGDACPHISRTIVNITNLQSDCSGIREGPKDAGRPPKKFDECTPRTQNRKTLQLRYEVDQQQLHYSVQKNLHAQGFHKAARAVHGILKNPAGFAAAHKSRPPEEPWSPEQALSVMMSMGSSVRSYQTLRNAATGNNSVLVPPYKKVQEAKLDCYPQQMQFDDISAEVPLQFILDHTASRLATLLQNHIQALSDHQATRLELLCKYGMDGSGGHSTYRQSFEKPHDLGSDTHVFMCSLVPIRIHVAGEEVLLWENAKPSSTMFCRVLMFKFARETSELVLSVNAHIRNQIEQLTPTKLYINGKTVIISHKMLCTMVDVKIINILTGTGSKTCFVCGALPSEVNDLDSVLLKPVNKDVLSFGPSPLHAKLRSFDALISIAKKMDIGKNTAKGDEEKLVVLARHALIQQRFQDEMQIIVDVPLPGGSGNSNDGNTARRFFDNPVKSASILEIDFDLVERMGNLNRMLSSKSAVDPNHYRQYALATAARYIEVYSWYPMTPTVHKMLVHGADFIQEAPVPVGQLSEEAQESLHKVLRSYREHFSRKSSRRATNEDVLKRLLIWSDPIISSIRMHRSKSCDANGDCDENLLECLQNIVDD